MEKIWLSSYPPGIPAEVDITAYRSVVDLFETSCRRFADRPACLSMGRSLSYAELDRLSRDFAAFLQTGLGLQQGDRIALMMPNLLQYPIALFGALRAGLVVVNTNPLYTARELRHQLCDSGAKAIVLLENFAGTLQKVIGDTQVEHVMVTAIGDMLPLPKRLLVNFVVRKVKKMVPAWQLDGAIPLRDALAKGAEQGFEPPVLGHKDLAFLQYTGGTTGVAKGAMLSHGNMVANMLQARAWISAGGVREGEELIVTALPLYHIFALTANALVFMEMGATCLLITNPRDLPTFVKELSKVQFTALTGVNTLFNALLNTPGFSELDFSRFKIALGGGMAVQPAVAERWKRVTGVTLVEAYGLTETSPAACINPLDLSDYNGTIGLPIPSTECCVRDLDGNELGVGEVGEVCIRGPQVMQGYWQRPDETAKVLDADGWLRTGDMGCYDEQGYFRIVDRLKDVINVSGFNVYPNEIEAVVAEHPGVLEVGAIGVPDEHSGEAVKVVVVRKDPTLTKEALHAHCVDNLTGYKRPKHIEFVDELPKTNVGKILRRKLRAEGESEPCTKA
jgi:long-chain acyl-CoA synthetase